MIINNSSKSSYISEDIKVNRNDVLALPTALKASQQFYSASRQTKKYKSLFTKLASELNRKVEAAIIKELLGKAKGGKISASAGGFNPDWVEIVEDEDGDSKINFRELKLSSVTVNGSKLERKSSIALAGGKGITLKRGTQELITGFNVDKEGSVSAVKQNIKTTRFFNELLKAQGNPDKLVKILSGRGKAAVAVKNTLVLKANTIDIPVVFNDKLQNRSIKFDWNDIKDAIKSKKGKITIIQENDTTLKFNFYFFASTITKALNSIDKVVVRELSGSLGDSIIKALSEMVLNSGTKQIAEIKKFLKDKNFEYALAYIPGSAIVSRGLIKSKKKKLTTQKFISGAQVTALVQKRMGQIMPKGPLKGPPLSDRVLTERTGRFRSSVTVIPNYKNNIMKYFYDPIYLSLVDTQRNPDDLIEQSIREVTKSLYSRQFGLQRII